MAKGDRSRCIPIEKRVDRVEDRLDDLVVEGASYAAGCGIDAAQLASGTIVVAVDGVTVICEDGVLKSFAAFPYVAGCGILMDAGVISAVVDGTTVTCSGGALSSPNQNLFSQIAVSGQTTVTANSATTELTLVAGSNVTITTNNTTKTITIASSGGGGGGGGGGAGSWLLGELDADVDANTASVSVTVIEYGGDDPGASETVNNVASTISTFPYIHVGTAGCKCIAIKNSSDTYTLAWIEPPVNAPAPA